MHKFLHGEITQEIIHASLSIHNGLGPGYLEKVYEKALKYELEDLGIHSKTQVPIPVIYKGRTLGEYYADLLVEDKVIVELKASKGIAAEHMSQLLSYLKTTGIEVGLIINFGEEQLKVKRVVNTKK